MNKYIRHLPVGFFGSVIGLSALAMAWRIAYNILDFPAFIGECISILAIADFIAISLAYMIKIFLHWQNVKAEFNHPSTGSLFSAIPISFMFVSGILLTYSPILANYLWHTGAICMTLFMIFIINYWIRERKNNESASLTWLLPVTGFVSIPFIGLSFPVRAMWLFSHLSFSGGLLLALTLFIILMSGFFLTKNQTGREDGAMLMLSAPFTMSFLSYIRISESVNQFADILYFSGLFLFIVFVPKIFLLLRSGSYHNTWWSLCFPLSLLSIAALKYLANMNIDQRLPTSIAIILLGMSSLVAVVSFFSCIASLFRTKLSEESFT